jgi:peptidoglycan/LPS O-acetylase OafA/YrhL
MYGPDGVATLRGGGRVPELDGIRGVAILLVLSLHFIVLPARSALRDWSPRLAALAGISWCGVDLFFVLSGFLIAGILLDHEEAPRVFRTFYLRRACRILPAYLVLPILAALPLAGSSLISQGRVPLGAYLLFLQNFWSAAGVPVSDALGPCWSLAIEEQFYLLLPVLLLRAFRRQFGAFAAVLLAAPPLLRCLLFAHGGPVSPWDFTPCRLDAPFWGVLAAVLVRDAKVSAFLGRRARGLGRAAIASVLAVAALSQLTLLSNGETLLLSLGLSVMGCAFALALVAVLFNPASGAARLMRSQPLRWAGKRSYFLYLFHQLIFGSLSIAPLPLRVAASAVVLGVLAATSWHLLESPFLRLGAAVPYGAAEQAAPAADAAG